MVLACDTTKADSCLAAQPACDLEPARSPTSDSASPTRKGMPWTREEHLRFLLGTELYPKGRWKDIAVCVGTRTERQTKSHAQKLRLKMERHRRGLRSPCKRDGRRTSPRSAQSHGDECATARQLEAEEVDITEDAIVTPDGALSTTMSDDDLVIVLNILLEDVEALEVGVAALDAVETLL